MTMPSRPAANEKDLREAFLPLRDPHERLSVIADACAGNGLSAEIRAVTEPIPGCVSKVWLVIECPPPAGLSLKWDSGSPLVRGLAGLICAVYQGAAPLEAAEHRSSILTDLGLDKQLSPTRLRGLESVEAHIRQWAAAHALTENRD